MKKLISLLICALIVIGASVSIIADEPEDVAFVATIIDCRYVEQTDKYTFCAVGGVYGNDAKDPFTFGIAKENIEFAEELSIHLDHIPIGQTMTVVFGGEVMESYPMQIIPSKIIIESEKEELTDNEKLEYLSMFFTEEWLIEKGYMEVPLADGEEADNGDYTDSGFVPDYDPEEYDSLEDSYVYVYGTPQAGDDAGKCVMLTEHYLEGFIVSADIFANDVEGAKNYASIYFLAYSNFNDEEIAPVRIDFEEGSVGMLGLKFSELTAGTKLKIYCDYGAYCVPVENEKYYRIDGEVVTIEKLDGFAENYSEYFEYFFYVTEIVGEVDTELLYFDEVDDDSEDTNAPIEEFDDETIGEDSSETVEAPTVKKKGGLMTAAVIVLCVAIIFIVIMTIAAIIKKK